MAWIKYTSENGVVVENDEDGSVLFSVESSRVGDMKPAAITDALRALLHTDEIRYGTFICDDTGIEVEGMAEFERQLYADPAPVSRHAGKFPHVGDTYGSE